MGTLIQFPEPPEVEYVTCSCGSAWWSANVVVTREGRVTGYTFPLKCVECGKGRGE